MKFVKQHLFSLICGVVALLALGAWFYPLPGMGSTLTDNMTSRVRAATDVHGLTQLPISVPGSDGTVQTFTGPVTPAVIEAKKRAQDQMAAQAAQIGDQVIKLNQKGRVQWDDPNQTPVPLLDGVPQRDLLPAIKANAFDFKDAYQNMFLKWQADIVGKNGAPGSPDDPLRLGSAPTTAEINDAWAAEVRQRVASQPLGAGGRALNTTASFPATPDPDFIKKQILNRASIIKCYCNLNPQLIGASSFQIRPWFGGNRPPTENEIFEAFVDTWVQHDIVNTVTAMNAKSKNVGDSAIKLLDHIQIGVNPGGSPPAISTAGTLFYLGSATAQFKAAPNPPNLDYGRDLTGHGPTAAYNVVLANISMVVNPNELNHFIDTLYRQNPFYTVLDISFVSVDPFESAANGYIYGDKPVIRVNLLVETLIYKAWTDKIMPPGFSGTGGAVPVDANGNPLDASGNPTTPQDPNAPGGLQNGR